MQFVRQLNGQNSALFVAALLRAAVAAAARHWSLAACGERNPGNIPLFFVSVCMH